ncbi:MAG TPA: aminopeptidase [Gemmatimonadales bacterium]|jgi:predicted aminopeptidase|nr:aminopeptidase [Gemmatimonadales bacterium]
MGRAGMIFVVIVGVLMAGYGTAYVASEDVRYLTRAGFEETRILQARKPITTLVSDPRTPPELKSQLQLVLDSRNYAATLGLAAKKTYTTYADVGRDTLLLNLSAAPKDCICPYTWKYPIVGRIPYKGFFDVHAAQREADRLAAGGYDIYLRPAAAFSTLGWFNDPLLSTALTTDSVELAALVFHEIAHNTLYVPSATPFNESYAQLVAYRAAEHFFRARGDSAAAQRAADRWHDEIVLGEYYDSLVGRLQRLYDSHPTPEAVDSGRADAARWARAQLEGPVGARLLTYRIGRLAERPINNAQLVGARIYRTRLDLFDRWYERHDADVSKSVSSLKNLVEGVEGDSALARLTAVLGDSP